jgi:hypothetical protein
LNLRVVKFGVPNLRWSIVQAYTETREIIPNQRAEFLFHRVLRLNLGAA